jgi:hypothetical protein
MKFTRTWVTEFLENVETGVIEFPPGTTREEFYEDDTFARQEMAKWYRVYIQEIESGSDEAIAGALIGWISECPRNEIVDKFLDEVPRLPTPGSFWLAFHKLWEWRDLVCERFYPVPCLRLARALRRYRSYWRQEYLSGNLKYAYENELPEFMTVYRCQRPDRRQLGLHWTGDFELVRSCASETGYKLIEARIAKHDIATFTFNWLKSDVVLFSARDATSRHVVDICDTPNG